MLGKQARHLRSPTAVDPGSITYVLQGRHCYNILARAADQVPTAALERPITLSAFSSTPPVMAGPSIAAMCACCGA